MEEKAKVNIYTDGACSGNPGPGGYGAVLVHVDTNGVKHEKEFSAGYKHVTNNQMELLAVIVAVEALKKPCNIVLTSDSKYVVEAFQKNWIDGWIIGTDSGSVFSWRYADRVSSSDDLFGLYATDPDFWADPRGISGRFHSGVLSWIQHVVFQRWYPCQHLSVLCCADFSGI